MKGKPIFFSVCNLFANYRVLQLWSDCGQPAVPTCSSHSLCRAALALHLLAAASLQWQWVIPTSAAHHHVQFISLTITHTCNITTKLSTALYRD